MVTRATATYRSSAAERRLLRLAPQAANLREAVLVVVCELLQGVSCPPTDLDALGQKLDVREIRYESFPGSGELYKDRKGYRIVCSSDQPQARQRFTVAHELAHVILDRTGRNAPRAGESVERLCDTLATECLMPTAIFEPLVSRPLTMRAISDLAKRFDTSLTAAAIRCAELRGECVFAVAGERVTWARGGVRHGVLVSHLMDQVRDGVRAVLVGEEPEPQVYFYGPGVREGYRHFEGLRLKNGNALFLLAQNEEPTSNAAP
jgi:hypothetical protein